MKINKNWINANVVQFLWVQIKHSLFVVNCLRFKVNIGKECTLNFLQLFKMAQSKHCSNSFKSLQMTLKFYKIRIISSLAVVTELLQWCHCAILNSWRQYDLIWTDNISYSKLQCLVHKIMYILLISANNEIYSINSFDIVEIKILYFYIISHECSVLPFLRSGYESLRSLRLSLKDKNWGN